MDNLSKPSRESRSGKAGDVSAARKPLQLVDKVNLVTNQLLAKKVLSGDQFKVACVLLFKFHNSKTGKLYPSYAQMADAAGVSESTAKRTVQVLKSMGLLTFEENDGGRNRRNNYTLHGPAEVVAHQNGVTTGPLGVSPEDPLSVSNGPLRVSPADPHISRNEIKEINKEEKKKVVVGAGAPTAGENFAYKDGEGAPPEAKPPAGKKVYAFKGEYVKGVTEEHVEGWLKTFSTFDRDDILSELRLCEMYYLEKGDDGKSWFFKTFAWLKRVNEGRVKKGVQPPVYYPSGRRADDDEVNIMRSAGMLVRVMDGKRLLVMPSSEALA